METYIIAAFSGLAICLILQIILLSVIISQGRKRQDTGEIKEDIAKSLSDSRIEMTNVMSRYIGDMGNGIRADQRTIQGAVSDSLRAIEERFQGFSIHNEQQLSDMRSTMERRLEAIQENNNKQLEEMRATVNEKLENTLKDRISQSFGVVSERLEQVYKGLGEMQTLAAGVGDLKRVLSNVKARGTLGEIQLETILSEFMVPQQYEVQFQVKEHFRVDYAIKMPGDDEKYVYLPIDAKFPMDAYNALLDAYETNNPDDIQTQIQELRQRIRTFARDISMKYINPPLTTDFAVMFLPVEGIYAEVVRSGIMEQVQREFKVSIVGPTTISALLSSLQMGFRTLAIQKHSGEVWKILGAVKTEFDKFAEILSKAQRQIDSANRDIDTLIGTRMRMMERRLNTVNALPLSESNQVLLGDASRYDPSEDNVLD